MQTISNTVRFKGPKLNIITIRCCHLLAAQGTHLSVVDVAVQGKADIYSESGRTWLLVLHSSWLISIKEQELREFDSHTQLNTVYG